MEWDKSEIRKRMKQKRQELTAQEIEKKSRMITGKLVGMPVYRSAENVFTYVSYNSEADTKELIVQSLHDGKNVFVPKVLSAQGVKRMEFFSISGLEELVFGFMGIPEPVRGEPAVIKEGLFIMPGLAFDRSFHRIGYGGGFYDSYLLRENAFFKAAICFDFQLLPEIPFDEYDIKPDIIITDKEVINNG